MCFSATASFIAGISLTGMGFATVKMTEGKAEMPFAMIPFLFGIQQLIEGVLWLSFKYEAHQLNVIMTYSFVFFSHVLWPIFMPFSIGLVETVAWRKKVILAFQITGWGVGLYLLYFIIVNTITSEIKVHVLYVFPHFHKPMVLLLYIAATCVSGFFSSHRMVRIFGFLALLLFIVSYWFYMVAFFSVWCFFSAILSVIIYLHLKSNVLGKKSTTNLSHIAT
jgi:hypothetical protein